MNRNNENNYKFHAAKGDAKNVRIALIKVLWGYQENSLRGKFMITYKNSMAWNVELVQRSDSAQTLLDKKCETRLNLSNYSFPFFGVVTNGFNNYWRYNIKSPYSISISLERKNFVYNYERNIFFA